MLLKPMGRVKRQLSFSQQLSSIKLPSYSQQTSKSNQHFKLTLSILDLMMKKYPKMTEELLILKTCLTKWQEHNSEQSISKNRQLLNMREDLIVYIKREVGIIFQQIGEYLKTLTEEYNDGNIDKYYIKYLTALKKLEWHQEEPKNCTAFANKEVQTECEQTEFKWLPTQKSISLKSNSTIQGVSPLKNSQQFQGKKFIMIKEENLQLEKKNQQLCNKNGELVQQNRNLKFQIDQLMEEVAEFRESGERYLAEIAKLTNILDKIKLNQDEKLKKEQQKALSLSFTQNKYKNQGSFKKTLKQTLQNAQQQILQKQQFFKMEKQQDQYSINYFAAGTDRNDKMKTVKKQRPNAEQEQIDKSCDLRLLLIQATVLEELLINDCA